MEVILLIAVLVVLVVVHEFGHFVVAKLSGMRVDEFGIGYPPRVAGFKYKETEYTLNAVPFGGFVKIYGEDLETPRSGADSSGSFASKPRPTQAAVLIAGIAMNLLLAFVLLTLVLFVGTPRALAPEEIAGAKDARLAVAQALPGSPASLAGLRAGDYILSATYGPNVFTGASPEEFTAFMSKDGEAIPVSIAIERAGKPLTLTATPAKGIVAADPERVALGVAVATVGTVPLSPWRAVLEGAHMTWEITRETAAGLTHLFAGLFTLSADLSQVSGPVGIAGAVGTASAQGFGNLVTLAAIISINLALINLLPVPALDGGRLLFVIIESVIRRPIKKEVATAVNTVGFALLVLLMLVVTAHDVYKLVV
ncbi:MAG: M50 family metallopeptidase [bacterium]